MKIEEEADDEEDDDDEEEEDEKEQEEERSWIGSVDLIVLSWWLFETYNLWVHSPTCLPVVYCAPVSK